jgi:hypothetical protein
MASSRLLSSLGTLVWVAAAYACNASSSGGDAPSSLDDDPSGGDGGGTPLAPDAGGSDGDGSTSGAEGGAAGPASSVVTIGAAFACLLARDGSVWCWGRNDVGQLGREPAATPSCGAFRCSPAPLKVEGLANVVRLAAGDDFACALTRAGFVSCWGGNAKGQLAATGLATSPTPRPVIARAADITAAGAHACALTTDGFAHCWGENTCEIFGTKEPIFDYGRRVENTPKFAQLSIGTDAICGTLLDATALCWGVDHKGSLGHDPSVGGVTCNGQPYDPAPRHVQGSGSDLPLGSIADVHVGSGVACARRTDGHVQCWGDNRKGGLGQGLADGDRHARPLEVPALIAKKLDVRAGTACAVVADRLFCWGDGQYGQLDTLSPEPACGSQVCRALPYAIGGMMPLRELAVGPGSLAAIKSDLSLWVWGRNGSGEVGVAPGDAVNRPCSGTVCVPQPRALTSGPTLN